MFIYVAVLTRYTAGSINLNANSPLGGASWNRIEAFVAKYDSSGNIQWQRGLGGYGKQYFSKITLDSSGNLYAVGRANGDLLIAKLILPEIFYGIVLMVMQKLVPVKDLMATV